jgi:hypothetical protein
VPSYRASAGSPATNARHADGRNTSSGPAFFESRTRARSTDTATSTQFPSSLPPL